MIKLKNILKEEQQFVTEFKRPELNYKLNSLNKYIDTKTMEEHYNVHFKKYTDVMNECIKEERINVMEVEQVLRMVPNYSDKLRNNAGGYYNHVIYFEQLTPEKKSPKGMLKDGLTRDFTNFKEEFTQAGLDLFGSGWVWLVVKDNGSLKIMTTPNQDNPLMNIFEQGGFPILGLDLWEHAYYLKYQNKRDEYIQNFWEVVNWKFVNELYTKRIESEKK